ncbi:MAG: hypothetical protein ABIH04_05280 [Planctomycetota bacterium]
MSKNEMIGSSVAKAIAGLLMLVVLWGIPSLISIVRYLSLDVGIVMLVMFQCLHSVGLVVCGVAVYSAYLAFREAKSARSGWGWLFVVIAVIIIPTFLCTPYLFRWIRSAWFPVNITVIVGFFCSIAWEVRKWRAKKRET